jgi:hypothetical protein
MPEPIPEKLIGWAASPGETIKAELLGLDRWRVTVGGEENPALAFLLTAQYRDAYNGPQDGYYGQLILRDLAEVLRGTYWFDQPPPGDPRAIP